jgi:hypothetical protein
MQERPESEKRQPPAPGRTRKPYSRPELIEYGSVTKLTQGTNTVGNDGPMGGFKNNMCL